MTTATESYGCLTCGAQRGECQCCELGQDAEWGCLHCDGTGTITTNGQPPIEVDCPECGGEG